MMKEREDAAMVTPKCLYIPCFHLRFVTINADISFQSYLCNKVHQLDTATKQYSIYNTKQQH